MLSLLSVLTLVSGIAAKAASGSEDLWVDPYSLTRIEHAPIARGENDKSYVGLDAGIILCEGLKAQEHIFIPGLGGDTGVFVGRVDTLSYDHGMLYGTTSGFSSPSPSTFFRVDLSKGLVDAQIVTIPAVGNDLQAGASTVVGGGTYLITRSPGATAGASTNLITFVGVDFTVDPPQIVTSTTLTGISSPMGLYSQPLSSPPASIAVAASIRPATLITARLSDYTVYGTTQFGGTANAGVLYTIRADGTGFKVLHNFSNSLQDGKYPKGNVIGSPDGATLYGTTSLGGPGGSGIVYSISTNGSNFKVLATPQNPQGELLLVGDTLYGTSYFGGHYQSANGVETQNGSIYSLKTGGTAYTTLYSFPPLSAATNGAGLRTNAGGANPRSGVLLSSNAFIGFTSTGGANGYGALYAVPLAPPRISASPASQWLSFGDFIRLPVEVDGLAPFGYQWQFNGVPMDGQVYNPYFNLLTSSNQLGNYSVIVTNAYGSVTSRVATVALSIVKNDGFETGKIDGWTLSAGAVGSGVKAGHDGVYDGHWSAYLGEATTNLNSLSQTLTTAPGQTYLLSSWLNTSGIPTTNEFQVLWDGVNIFEAFNMPGATNDASVTKLPPSGWTNLQFRVAATTGSTLLQFNFQTGSTTRQFVLDDIRITPLPPTFSVAAVSIQNQILNLSWKAAPNARYQVQSSPSLLPAVWTDVGTPVSGDNGNGSVSVPATGKQGYYRLVLLP